MVNDQDYQKFDELVRKATEDSDGDIFCPRCGSSRLYYFVGGGAGWIHVCKVCNYHGHMVIEDGEIAEDIRNKGLRKSKK